MQACVRTGFAVNSELCEERHICNLQQLAATLGGCGDLIWVEAKLCAGALVVQQQAVHQWRDEGARRRLACERAVLQFSPATLSVAVQHRSDHEAAVAYV